MDVSGMGLTPDGTPRQVVRTVDLDALAYAEAATWDLEERRAVAEPALTVGVSRSASPLLDSTLARSLTLTLAPQELGPLPRHVVGVPDLRAALADLRARIARRPQAAVTLGMLLRQTEQLPTLPGLAAEAAAYSMLLAGREFAAWRRSTPRRAPRRVPSPLVEVARDEHTLRLTLADPSRRNAFSFGMREELREALELPFHATELKEIRITGAGTGFCSGGDLDEFGTADDIVAAFLVRLDRAPWRLIDQLAERTTVVVHGATVGAGLELAAFAGHVVARPDALMWLPELDLGLVPGAGGTVSITRRAGRWRTAWLVLTGQRLTADQGLDWGLVDELVEA